MMTHFRSLIFACFLFTAAALPTRAEEWSAARLWIVGGEQTVWVVASSRPQGDPAGELRMWVSTQLGANPAAPSPSRFLLPVTGDPLFVGADAEALRVMFGDVTAYDYFTDRRGSPGAIWKKVCSGKPLAWGGDSTQSVFWAVVRSKDIVIGPTTAATTTTAEAEENSSEGSSNPFSKYRHVVMQLQGGIWRPLPIAFEGDKGTDFWITGRDKTAHLFWRTAKNEIRYSWYENGQWALAESVTADKEVKYGWVGVGNSGPVFIAGFEDRPGAVRLRMILRNVSGWTVEGPVRDGNEPLIIKPQTSGVGVAGGQLCVARVDDTGKIETGYGELNASPSMRFTKLRIATPISPAFFHWQEIFNFTLTLIIATAILFSRRETLAQPATLPRGWMIAPIWKRLAATILDMLPAAIFMMPWLFSVLDGLDLLENQQKLIESAKDPEFAIAVLPVSYAMCALYGVWCFIWEASIGTTPGKRLFGCRVASLDGQPLVVRQIFVRNLIRVVICAMDMVGPLTTLMVMIMVSKNRQRLGDLAARTIVIQRGIPVARRDPSAFE